MYKFNLPQLKRNRRKNSKSILTTLFIPYTFLFILTFFIVSSYFVYTEAKRIRDDALLSVENNVTYTSDWFDKMVDSLDTASQNIIYSNLVKSHFAAYLGYTESAEISNYDSLQNTKVLNDLLVAIIGPNSLVDQTYLYGLEKGSVGVGRNNHATSDSIHTFPWYDRVADSHGEKYVHISRDERLFPYFSYEEGRYFLSLTRKYYNSLNIPQGYVETEKSMTRVNEAIKALNLSYDEKIYAFSSDGDLLYPYVEHSYSASDAENCRDICFDESIESVALRNVYLKELPDNYVLFQQSTYTGIITAAVVSKKKMLSPVRVYLSHAIVLLLFLGLAMALVSYYISKKISNPIGLIYSQISSFEISSGDIETKELPDIDTSIIELNGLYKALITMQTKTRKAIDNELQLQNREMQSRMLALQAQMNPHFLYNSLATIQALADEGMTDEVYYLCQNISDILRYISSDSDQMVFLRDEVKHTISYLNCMKLRYNNELTYHINIPEEMMECRIPKLCLQLIVENAIKYSTKKKGPWVVDVNGVLTSTYWELHIIDNGPGFSPEAIDDLQREIDKIDQTGSLPNLEINGMGLLNIYIRFKLLYKGRHIFRLSNNLDEGARVSIGGAIE